VQKDGKRARAPGWRRSAPFSVRVDGWGAGRLSRPVVQVLLGTQKIPFKLDSTLLCPGGEGERPPLSMEQVGPASTQPSTSYSHQEQAATRPSAWPAGHPPVGASWTPV
jgi:hypothetical protein